MQRLVLGDNRWLERQVLRERSVLILVVAVATPFLPLDGGQRLGLFGVLLAGFLLSMYIHFWALPRWPQARRMGLISVGGDAALLVAALALTGGLVSPMWGVSYLFTTTVAIRYGTQATLAAAVLLASLYAASVFPGAAVAEVGPEFAIRISFFVYGAAAFAGILAEQAWTAYARLREQLRRSELHLAANAAIEPGATPARSLNAPRALAWSS